MKMISRACPICGAIDEKNIFSKADFDDKQLDEFAFASRKIPEYMHYRLVHCIGCDLIYASPVPTLEMLEKAYQEADFDSSEEAHFASRTYGRFLRNISCRIPDKDGALDIGTGDGSFLEQLIAKGFSNVIGIEPSMAPVKAAKDIVKPLIKQCLFHPDEFESNSFSLVTCFQTIEHLYDPMEMGRNVYNLLKKGGAAFFICHNHRSFSTKLLGIKSPIFDIEHLQLFSPKSASLLMERCGYTDIEVKTIWNIYPIHYWMKLFPMPLQLKLSFLSILKKIKIGYLPVSIPAGNIAVIGYKK